MRLGASLYNRQHTYTQTETTHFRRKAQGKYLSAGIMGEPLAVQVDLAAYSRKRPSPRTIYRRSIKFTVEIFFQTPLISLSASNNIVDPAFLSIIEKEELLESFPITTPFSSSLVDIFDKRLFSFFFFFHRT